MGYDRNRTIEVGFIKGDECEIAQIALRSIGMCSELRYETGMLRAVGKFQTSDIQRFFSALVEAERKRIDPDDKFIESLNHALTRIDYMSENKSALSLDVELEMPVASTGSVKLEPMFEGQTPEDDWAEDQ